tara:strand:- start:1681 stop:1782 length:102 start_codon:yes stop_codon:yes gene_type:complete
MRAAARPRHLRASALTAKDAAPSVAEAVKRWSA